MSCSLHNLIRTNLVVFEFYLLYTLYVDVQIQFLERVVYVQNGTDAVELGLTTNIRLERIHFNVTIACNSEEICKSLYKYFALQVTKCTYDPKNEHYYFKLK